MARFQPVTHYIWELEGVVDPYILERSEWWDGTLEPNPNGSGKCIVTNPVYNGLREPDFERLECGHEQPVRSGRGRKYYNLRRRCDVCAMGLR